MASESEKGINLQLRKLPGVDLVLNHPQIKGYIKRLSQPVVVSIIREELNNCRDGILKGNPFSGKDALIEEIIGKIEDYASLLLKKVINATGIIIHTNLGRSPITEDILKEISDISSGYSNLEYDLFSGKRGKRGTALRRLISIATGCESALVVNNNAAALFLILAALAKGKEVVISRGELVQIGGGFKIPEIMSASGALMREVGTTNRTSVDDYKNALTSETSLILKVHRSNFVISGFTEEAGFSDLVSLGRQRNLPVVIDLGSGAILPPSVSGLDNEPTVHNALTSGADLVCFSGDKLLGGCQGGIILGKVELIEKLNKNPLYRVVRPDKTTIGILEKLFLKYLKGEIRDIPIWHMIAESKEDLLERTKKFIVGLELPKGVASITDSFAYAGGGSDPGGKINSVAVVFEMDNSAKLSCLLREGNPPVVGRIEEGKLYLDLRTVFPEQEGILKLKIEEAFRKL